MLEPTKRQQASKTDRYIIIEREREKDLVATIDLWCNPEDSVVVIDDVTRCDVDTDSVAECLYVRINEVCKTPATHLRHLSNTHTTHKKNCYEDTAWACSVH